MRTFCVDVEHPHKGRMVRTVRTVEANSFDHAVQKAMKGFPEPKRPMSVLFEISEPDSGHPLFEEAE